MDFFPNSIFVSNTEPIINDIIPVSNTKINCGVVGRICKKALNVPMVIVTAITPRFPTATIRLMNAANFLFLFSFIFLSHPR